jgi:hypothetical protein
MKIAKERNRIRYYKYLRILICSLMMLTFLQQIVHHPIRVSKLNNIDSQNPKKHSIEKRVNCAELSTPIIKACSSKPRSLKKNGKIIRKYIA